MNRIFIMLWLFLSAATAIHAQTTSYPEKSAPRISYLHLFEEGEDLYDKGLFGAAYQKFDDFLEAEQNAGLRKGINNDLHTLAEFFQAVSAYEIRRNDAIIQLNRFIEHYPENTRTSFAYFYKGKYYFDRKDFEAAIPALEAAHNAFILPKEQEDEALFMLGYAYFLKEKDPYDDTKNEEEEQAAIRYFNQLSYYENPYQEDARYYKAVLLYQREEYGQAYAALKALSNSRKYGYETKMYLANTLLKLKKYDELFELADEMIEDRRRNENPQLYHLVANASYEQNDYENTVRYFQEYISRRGKMGRIDYFRMGYASYDLENYAEAIPAFKKVLSEEDSIAQLSSYYLGFSYIQVDDLENAKYAFQKGIRKDEYGFPLASDDITMDSYFQYAKIAYATRDFEAARKALVDIEQYFPDAPYIDEARTLLGEVWLQNRNYPEAIKYFESVPRNTLRSKQIYQQVNYYYALELYEKKEFEEADIYLQKAIDNRQDQEIVLSAHYWLGESAFRQENYDQATRLYQRYLNQPGSKTHNYYAAVYYSLGWSYFKAKNYNQSLNYFDQFTRLASPTTPERILVDAYLRAGDCLFLLRKYDQANSYYNKVTGLGNAYQDNALYQMAEGYYRRRDYTASVNTFDKLIRQYRDSPLRDNALDRISEIYITWLKEYRKGASYADMLVRQYPQSPLAPDALARLALAAYNTDNINAAINYFKKILADYGSDRKNAQIALDNLSGLLPPNEFDRVLSEYRKRNPQLNENMAQLTFNTALDRYFSQNYSAAIKQFTDYIQNFTNGPHYFEALLYRARSYKATHDITRALNDYELIYRASMRNDFTNVALLEAAEINFEQQQYQKSIELYQMLANIAQAIPNRVQAAFGLAKNYRAMRNYDREQQVLEEIAENPEVELELRTRAHVEIGEAMYNQGKLQQAYNTLAQVEREFNNEWAARAQYLIIRILFDQQRYEEVKEAGKHMNNTYPSFNYLKAQAFLIVAEANYELGETFQAKGVLESLIDEANFPDIQDKARRRLAEIEAEERSREAQPAFPDPDEP